MKCPQCSGEMSKKWNPQTAVRVAPGSAVVWACGVCGCQLTQAEMKQASKDRHKAPTSVSPVFSPDTVELVIDKGAVRTAIVGRHEIVFKGF